MIRYVTSTEDYQKVVDFFRSIDNDFLPPLTEREGGIEGHLHMPMKNGNILLQENQGEVNGAFAYWEQGDTVHLELMGVAPESRNGTTLYRLIRRALDDYSGDASSIQFQTWSTNKGSKAALKHLPFRKIAEVEGHLHPDRVTEVYQTELDDIVGYFGGKSDAEIEPIPQLTGFNKYAAIAMAALWMVGSGYVTYDIIAHPENYEDMPSMLFVP